MILNTLRSVLLAGAGGLALVMAMPHDAPAQELEIDDDGFQFETDDLDRRSAYRGWYGGDRYDRSYRWNRGFYRGYRGYSPYYGGFHPGYRQHYGPGVYRERYPHYPGHHAYPHPHEAYQFGPFRIERWH